MFGWFKYPGYKCNACLTWIPRVFGEAEVLRSTNMTHDLQGKRIVTPVVLLRCPKCRKKKFWG